MNNRRRNRCKNSRSIKFRQVEIWNMDTTLCNIILSGLTQYKNSERHGYPGSLNSFEQWNDILDTMIWSFTEIKNGYKGSPAEKYSMKMYQEYKSLDDLEKTFVFPDDVMEEQKVYRDRIRKGLHNFAEYFEGLWD